MKYRVLGALVALPLLLSACAQSDATTPAPPQAPNDKIVQTAVPVEIVTPTLGEMQSIYAGTATLEAALLGCPHVILYRFSSLTYLIARLVIGRRIIGLPNVILGRSLFPELIQRDVTAVNIVRSVRRIVADRGAFDQSVAELQATMGPPGASRRAAEELVELIR